MNSPRRYTVANVDYVIEPGGNFCPYAVLAAGIDYLTETLTFVDLVEPYEDSMRIGMTLLIDDELMLLYELGTGTMKCRRGCADTIPAQHGTNADIWFIEAEVQGLRREYAGGDQVSVKVLPFIPGGETLPVEVAIPFGVTMNWRFFRPYPPGQMRVNGARWYATGTLSADTAMLALTWVHRNRVSQGDMLVGHDEANVAPEIGQTYTLRVYDAGNALVRTEVGITGQSYNYGWNQALNDFGLATDVVGQNYNGRLEFESDREGMGSWQFYVSNFILNNRNSFTLVAQAGAQVAQVTDEGRVPFGVIVGQAAEQAALGTDEVSQHLLMTGQLSEAAGQVTTFVTPLIRQLFESPYTHNLRLQLEPTQNRVMSVTARPSDRLTDTHAFWARPNDTQPFINHNDPVFTPWLLIDETLQPLQTVVPYHTTSFTDGIALTNVRAGQLALLAGEIVRIDALNSTHVTIARGCVDTIPYLWQGKGTRLWFIGAGGGINCKNPLHAYQAGDATDNRIVPGVYGSKKLDPLDVPRDTIKIRRRAFLPFPPGEVLVNGQPWFTGVSAQPGQDMVITWRQRNRVTQGDSVLDHHAARVPHEVGTTYRLKLELHLKSGVVKLREFFVTGESFVYPYAMAYADGMRAGQLLEACGWVIVPMYLDAFRDGYQNWQGYSIPLRLPSYACPINTPPGGGQGPGDGGGGAGEGGGGAGTGSGGDGGDPTPPPIPPTWPPVPPDPIKPTDPGEPDPDDTEPDPDDTGEHWDFIWDIHWDAYRRHGDDDIGEG
jgi:hypothetical protein